MTAQDGAERRVALLVSYAGGAFAGFQRQPAADTVQSRLEQALGALLGGPVTVRGAGRTDAGVHAAGQVVDCLLPPGCPLPPQRLPQALAGRLPPDIAVAAAFAVPADFHARKSAVSKRYRYLLWREATASPFWRPYAWHYSGHLDTAAMGAAAAVLLGRHDFRAFAGAARPVADARRTLLGAAVYGEGPWLAIEIEADGFLYRMVRAIAGTLLEVGRGAMSVADVRGLLRDGLRSAAGPSLPAHGLCLLWVRYPAAAGLPAPGGPPWPPPPGPPPWRA